MIYMSNDLCKLSARHGIWIYTVCILVSTAMPRPSIIYLISFIQSGFIFLWKWKISMKKLLDIKMYLCAEQKYGYSEICFTRVNYETAWIKIKRYIAGNHIFNNILPYEQKCRPFIPLCDQSGIHAVQDNTLRALPLQQLRPLCRPNNKFALS